VKTYVATKNAGKLDELRAIFDGSPLELDTWDAYADVDETADSYAGNALLKAEALAVQLRQAGIDARVLADDSGLEVVALDGRPGIYSARYAGAEASWRRRRTLLLEELRSVPPAGRQARFVCTMALVGPGLKAATASGTVAGRITEEERGSGGFGYDPLFYYPPLGCTFAELDPTVKNAVSHRHEAAQALLATLRADP
jgi:XTP/dITP diphosphohydrolase